jgi:hypothetical protein
MKEKCMAHNLDPWIMGKILILSLNNNNLFINQDRKALCLTSHDFKDSNNLILLHNLALTQWELTCSNQVKRKWIISQDKWQFRGKHFLSLTKECNLEMLEICFQIINHLNKEILILKNKMIILCNQIIWMN